ncbi:MAG TPA: hypothetical protein VKT81_22515 [Bryobacteraceae bacterium]|nr:hypothetical protein [Bryobacteraceae bacterium]
MSAEITFDGFDPFSAGSNVLYVPELFTIRGMAKISDERHIALTDKPFDIEMMDEVLLRVPAARFEHTLADVVVIVGAGEREVVRQ